MANIGFQIKKVYLGGWQTWDLPLWSYHKDLGFYSINCTLCHGLSDGGLIREIHEAMERAKKR